MSAVLARTTDDVEGCQFCRTGMDDLRPTTIKNSVGQPLVYLERCCTVCRTYLVSRDLIAEVQATGDASGGKS